MKATTNIVPTKRMREVGCDFKELGYLYLADKLNIKEIADYYSVDPTTANSWLVRGGLKSKGRTTRFTFNAHFFDEIDTEEKAYWLGFIWCDGTIVDHSHGNPQFKLSLSSRDIEHVYKFKKAIDSNHNIHEYKISGNGKDTGNTEARILLIDRHFTDTLRSKYRLLRNRPEVFPMEHIPHSLVKHFIRGVYDADGSITKYHTQEKNCLSPTLKVCIQLYSNILLVDYIQQYFVDEGLRNRKTKTIKRHKDRDGNSTGLNISGVNQTIRLLKYLYDDAEVYLDRKLKDAEDIYDAVSARREKRGIK